MSWSFSHKLLADEVIIEDSSKMDKTIIEPAYSILLTNKRVIFRFDSLGSLLAKSIAYEDIYEVLPCKRLFVDYLLIKAMGREFLFNISSPGFWAKQIMDMKSNSTDEHQV